MSASKSKAIDKLNEAPIKKAAPKKAKAARAKREAALPGSYQTETMMPIKGSVVEHTQDEILDAIGDIIKNADDEGRSKIAAALIAGATMAEPEPEVVEQPKDKLADIPPLIYARNMDELSAHDEAYHAANEPEPSKEETLLEVWKRKGYLWIFGGAILLGLIAVIGYNWIQNAKDKKHEKQTQQVETKINTDKERLQQIESHLSPEQYQQNAERLQQILNSAAIISEQNKMHEAALIQKVEQLQKENDELQKIIATADSATLIELGRGAKK